MGTNYYLVKDTPAPCNHCGRPYESERKHIGKSSAGWVFSLHIIPEEGIDDLDDWQRVWSRPGWKIEDEYGETVSPDEMLARITQRHGMSRLPGGGGDRFAGHGAGTWDKYTGEFC
jgi:hypothetical protein